MRRKCAVVWMVGLIVLASGGWCLAQQSKVDGAATAQQKSEPAQDQQDKAVAKVNGTTITEASLDRELDGIQRRMARQGQAVPDEALSQMRGKVLDQMIGQTLLYQESRNQKIQVDEKQIQTQTEEMAKSFDDSAAFDLALGAAGISRQILTERLRQQDAIRQLVETKIIAGIKVAEARADEFYKANPELFVQPEQVRARHILIRADDQADAQAREATRKQMEEIRKQAVAGSDFADLAKTHSQDPGSKESGGDLGFFARGQMVKPFEEAAFALSNQEISPIVETKFGYHLIQVTERKPAETVALEQAKPQILEHLKQQDLREKLDAYVDKLRKEAKIETFI